MTGMFANDYKDARVGIHGDMYSEAAVSMVTRRVKLTTRASGCHGDDPMKLVAKATQ